MDGREQTGMTRRDRLDRAARLSVAPMMDWKDFI